MISPWHTTRQHDGPALAQLPPETDGASTGRDPKAPFTIVGFLRILK
jgi:hypothetical protein